MIKIETYKDHTIYYDEDSDKFTCDMEIEDVGKSSKRMSLKDMRSEINTFIKQNLSFKPFKILYLEYGSVPEVKEVQAVRADGKLVIPTTYGDRKEFIEVAGLERIAFVYDEEIVKAHKDIKKRELEFHDKIMKEIVALKEKLIPIDLSKYKNVI